MKFSETLKDLLILVADKNMQATFEALIRRHDAIGIRPLDADVLIHPRKDPGCRMEAVEFLRPFSDRYSRVMVAFDHEGSGAEKCSPSDLESELRNQLDVSGWEGRCHVVVIAPELETWIWSPSKKVDEICGWSGRIPALRDWVEEHFSVSDSGKPSRPKEALEKALRLAQKVRSSSLFREIAGKASWRGCADPSFQRFLQTLKQWFPVTTQASE